MLPPPAPSQMAHSNRSAPSQIPQSNRTASNQPFLTALSFSEKMNVEVVTFNYRELRLEGSISYFAGLGEYLSTGENILTKDTNVSGDAWKQQQQQRRRQKQPHPHPQSLQSSQPQTSQLPHSENNHIHHHRDATDKGKIHHITFPPLLRHPDPPVQIRQALARVVNPANPTPSQGNHTNNHAKVHSKDHLKDHSAVHSTAPNDHKPTHPLFSSSSPATFREDFHEKWSSMSHSMRSCPSWTHPLVIVLPVYKGNNN